LIANLEGKQSKTVLVPYFVKDNNNYGFQDAQNGTCFGGILPGASEMPAYCLGDFNNDGIDDVLVIAKKCSGGYLNGRIHYLKLTGYNYGVPQYNIFNDTIKISSSVNISDVIASDYINDGFT